MDTKLLDCTIRDGGYINNWNFSDEYVNDLYESLIKCNYNYIELGYINRNNYYKDIKTGKWRNLLPSNINIKKNNIKISVMCDSKEFQNEYWNDYNSNIDLVRLAFHKDGIVSGITNASILKNMGYKVSINVMGIISYSDKELQTVCEGYLKEKLDYIYIADSYGGMTTNDIDTISNKLKRFTNNNIKLGFHAHNNLQNGITNVFHCIHNGFDLVDTTVLGMGRGVGNAPTEILLSILSKKYNKYKLFPIIKFINKHMNSSNKNNWGYSIPYLISGHFNCHPSYISKLNEYKVTDFIKIWEIIKELSETKLHNKFDKNLIKKYL